MANKRAYIPAIAWTLLIGLGCLLPPASLSKLNLDTLFSLDKLIHLVIFIGFSIFWLLALASRSQINHKQKIYTFIIGSLYGILIEILQQSLWIGRSFEWGDILADITGALIGALLSTYVIRFLPFAKKRLPFINHLY